MIEVKDDYLQNTIQEFSSDIRRNIVSMKDDDISRINIVKNNHSKITILSPLIVDNCKQVK